MDDTRVIHTIPVPRGWSPEQAWEAIERGVLLTDPYPNWANIETRNGKFFKLWAPDDEVPDGD